MGNHYSVVREEQEEEEFHQLIEAVEIAQQRAARLNDLEAGLPSPVYTASSPSFRYREQIHPPPCILLENPPAVGPTIISPLQPVINVPQNHTLNVVPQSLDVIEPAMIVIGPVLPGSGVVAPVSTPGQPPTRIIVASRPPSRSSLSESVQSVTLSSSSRSGRCHDRRRSPSPTVVVQPTSRSVRRGRSLSEARRSASQPSLSLPQDQREVGGHARMRPSPDSLERVRDFMLVPRPQWPSPSREDDEQRDERLRLPLHQGLSRRERSLTRSRSRGRSHTNLGEQSIGLRESSQSPMQPGLSITSRRQPTHSHSHSGSRSRRQSSRSFSSRSRFPSLISYSYDDDRCARQPTCRSPSRVASPQSRRSRRSRSLSRPSSPRSHSPPSPSRPELASPMSIQLSPSRSRSRASRRAYQFSSPAISPRRRARYHPRSRSLTPFRPRQRSPVHCERGRSPIDPRALHGRPLGTRVERLMWRQERALAEHGEHLGLWREHTKQLVRTMQDIEQHLASLRLHGALSSKASLDGQPQVTTRGGGQLDEKPGVAAYAKPYPHRPYAVGLRAVRRCTEDWRPAWQVFPLKAFRGSSYTYIRIQAQWDDADLLRELGRSYDQLRTVWRKWFSLRGVRSITMVHADHTCVYPRRLGPARVSPAKNMRLRYFLHHPEQMRGRHEFMQVLTARTDLGIEFVEGWQLMRIAVAILLPVAASLLFGILYSVYAGDVSDAFTIAGYMTSAYSVCLVLLGLLNFVEF